MGYIALAVTSDLSSSGGDITLSGGADLTTGYARATGANGVSLGGFGASTNSINSAGGNILVRGYSNFDVGSDFHGIQVHEGTSINSGTGTIALYGKSDDLYGLEIGSNTNAGVTIESAATSGTAITLDGYSTTAFGLVFNYNVNKQILANGGGDISITGVATTNNNGIFLSDIDILATSGTITIDGGIRGITSGGSNPGVKIGSKAGSSITSSSSDINIIGDSLNLGSYTSLSSTGALTIKEKTAATTIGVAGAAGH